MVEPFQRLVEKGELLAHPHDGFWQSMDTFKDRKAFEGLSRAGDTPWQVWERGDRSE